MSFHAKHFDAEPPLEPALLEVLLTEHLQESVPRLQRLWRYYRNELLDHAPDLDSGRYRMAQERGLPARLLAGPQPRERVVENDIGWRVHTLVDFMFSKPVTVHSLCADEAKAQAIEALLRQTIEASGGVRFYQDLALLGAVYGHVDVLLRVQEGAGTAALSLEIVEAPRGLPVLSEGDYRRLEAYVVHVRQQTQRVEPAPLLGRVRGKVLGRPAAGRRVVMERTQVFGPDSVASYEGVVTASGSHRRPVEVGPNRLGRVPVVHIQNLPQPFSYEGISDVEPLIPLQDELNTRLSDRANRVTFQSFKMYLGKGIEGFHERPVGPGQMWSTDNPDAAIEEFGGDGPSPSETAHISPGTSRPLCRPAPRSQPWWCCC